MKNKLTRKLMLSAFTLLFAVISLGASTYAWFVMSNDAKVEAFTGTVAAGESGLEIAISEIGNLSEEEINNLKWRSTALNIVEDLGWLDEDGKNINPIEFDALQTSVNEREVTENETTVKKYDFKPNFSGLSGTTNQTTPVANKDYVAFRLYFRLADADENSKENVYLTDYDLNGPKSVNGWYVNKGYNAPDGSAITAGSYMQYNVKDAARIAFVTENDVKTYEEENNTLNPSNNKSSGIGKNGAYDYYKNVIGEPAGYPEHYYDLSTLSADESNFMIGEIEGKGYVYVDVYVWIDGWDMECINAIFEQTLEVVLKFSLTPGRQENDN